jgi:ornithine decarboxylase
VDAVHLAREAFDIAAEIGFDFKLLDIGGGFPGNCADGLQFKEIALLLAPCIDSLFPPQIRVIAEPGRYFVSSAFSLAVNIHSRRLVINKPTLEAYKTFLGSTDDDTKSNNDTTFMCNFIF